MAAPAALSLDSRLQRSLVDSQLSFKHIAEMAMLQLGLLPKKLNGSDPIHAVSRGTTQWAQHQHQLGTLENKRLAVKQSCIQSQLIQKGNAMLGLFATEAISKGEWVTLYGGVLVWQYDRRIQFKNTHTRRIPDSNYVLDGRPWAVLLRSSCRGATLKTEGSADFKVTICALINTLLQLAHENLQCHGQPPSSDSLHPSTWSTGESKVSHPSDCEIQLCLAELDEQDEKLPCCVCCGAIVGILPCEAAAIVLAWPIADQASLQELLEHVQAHIRADGLGYMANASTSKAALNVQCISVSPYAGALASIQPKQLIYKATRDIAAGEEILVAYNNNESKMF